MQVSYSSSQEYLITSRDFLYIKLWDSRRPDSPLSKFKICDYLDQDYQAMYDKDCMFDRFDLKWSHKGSYLATGSYNDSFTILDLSSTVAAATVPLGSTTTPTTSPMSTNADKAPEARHLTLIANSDQVRLKNKEI
jgi:hypothetical protein